MRATEYLRTQAKADWDLATKHAFTNALAEGTLDKEKMAGYLQQDYQFIDAFVRLLASAVAHAPTLADCVPGAQFLGLICGPENTDFLRSMEALDVPAIATPAPETVAFQALMQTARLSGRFELMLAVLVVAEWVYLEWARPFEEHADGLPFWFGEWITLHTGGGFERVVDYLRGQLDSVWDDLDQSARDEVEEMFLQAVALERAFFDAAWVGYKVQR